MNSISEFVQTFYHFNDNHYELLSRYFETIGDLSTSDKLLIKNLIVAKQHDAEMVDFLGVWIGYDKLLNNIIDNIIRAS